LQCKCSCKAWTHKAVAAMGREPGRAVWGWAAACNRRRVAAATGLLAAASRLVTSELRGGGRVDTAAQTRIADHSVAYGLGAGGLGAGGLGLGGLRAGGLGLGGFGLGGLGAGGFGLGGGAAFTSVAVDVSALRHAAAATVFTVVFHRACAPTVRTSGALNTPSTFSCTDLALGGVGTELTLTVACTQMPAAVQPSARLPGGASN
jgi:hypothetical protein